MTNKETLNKDIELNSYIYQGIYKSAGRAYRRNHITSTGVLIPKRPFNNRGNTCKRRNKHSRTYNQNRKSIYGQFKF